MFNPGELPLALLALARLQPLTAYEFLSELERLFGPAYKPSPGGIYPALRALTAERLLAGDRDGRATRYRITKRGEEALQRRRRQLAALQDRTRVEIDTDGAIRAAVERVASAAADATGRADAGAVCAVLESAANEIRKLTSEGDPSGKSS